MTPCILKHRLRIHRGLALTALYLITFCQLPAQMDTLFFEDFVDNRRNWSEMREGKWQQYIKDGYLHTDVRPGNNAYPSATLEHKLTNPDRFIYEVKIVPEDLRFGGLTFKYHYQNPEQYGKQKLLSYQGLVADRKGLFFFEHAWQVDLYDGKRIHRNPDMHRSAHVLRVELRDGMIHCYHNGELMHSEPNRISKNTDPWRYWGFMSRGRAKFKVDYMLLMASESANP